MASIQETQNAVEDAARFIASCRGTEPVEWIVHFIDRLEAYLPPRTDIRDLVMGLIMRLIHDLVEGRW